LVTTNPNNWVGFVAEIGDTALPVRTTTTLSEDVLYLYPNPAHGTTTVRVPVVADATAATLTLFDAMGRAVHTQTATPGTNSSFSLAGLVLGLYVLRMQAGKLLAIEKLVVE
jgi:hypothetical protein